MRPLNIFVVHPSDMLTDHLPNGAGWIVYNYLQGLAERGHTLHVATPRIELRGPLSRNLHVHHIPQLGGALARFHYMRAVRRLLGELSKSVSFDIAQQFTPVETGLSFSMLGSGIPLVLGPYSGYWPADADGPPRSESAKSRLKRFMRGCLAKLQQRPARALVITCPAAIERVSESPKIRARVHVIGHGIDSREYRQRDSIPERRSILFLANLEYRKGIFTLLDAFDEMADAVPDCTLEIWGTGDEAPAVESRILRSPHSHRIHCHGRAARENVGAIMRSHSVFCMPSYGEPFGMTLLEAMASGVPVVTTDAGGPPHILHAQGGHAVPVRDSKRLAASLVNVLNDVDLQRAMGRRNRERIEQEFDWSKSLDKMESVYWQILNEGQSTALEWRPSARRTSAS